MSEYTYELASGHCSELLAFMDEQRKAKDENLCDVRFIIGNDCVYAHRAVLAVCSAYFQGLLSGAFSESHAEGGTNCRMMEIDFTGSVSNIAHLDTLLSAVYTGSLKLSSENITGVTELACFLLIERVRIVCEMFLMENLAIHTCLHYLKLAYRYDLTALFTACRRLLHSRFHDHFIYQPEMLTVAAPCLILLPKIFRFVCLRDVIQFLVHWVEGELDVGETSSNREERLTTACSILYTHRHSVRLTYCDGVSQTSLTGNGDIISRLLSHCSPWWEGLHSRSSVLDGVVRNSCLDNCSQEVQTVLPMHIAGKTANSKELHHSNAGGNSCGGIGTIHAYSQDKKIHDKEEASCIRNTDDPCSMYAQSGNHCDSGQIVSCNRAVATNCDKLITWNQGRLSVSSQDKSVVSCSHTSLVDSQVESDNTVQAGSSGSSHNDDKYKNGGQNKSDYNRDESSVCFSFKRKRNMAQDKTPSSASPDISEVLVAFAPGKEAVNYFTATDCSRSRPRYCPIEFEVCLYHIQQKQWLWAGKAIFPEKYEERDSWKVACVNCKAYFLSLHRHALHMLDLKTLQWHRLDCQPLFRDMSSNSKVRSLVPIAVDGRLYVLASDRQWDSNKQIFQTQQRYFRLTDDHLWHSAADVQHSHMSTPLTISSVSDEKIFVVKATISLNLEKSMLLVQEGHIFDCIKEEVTKWEGTTYTASPTRLLVGGGNIHLVDGDCMHLQLLLDSQCWDRKGKVDLSDIKLSRAAAGESYVPCLTHSSSCLGSSAWEFCAFYDHKSTLTELCLNQDNDVLTVRHPPPPFHYVTVTTASKLCTKFVSSLKPCHYLHADKVN